VHPVVIIDAEVSITVRTLGAEINDVARYRSEGYDVEDDNDPAPENAPVSFRAGVQQQDSSFGEWGATTLCYRRAEDRRFENPKILKTRPDIRLGWFRYFLMMKYITSVLLVETSKVLPGKPLTLGEFIWFIGLWLIMATTAGNSRTSFFEQTEPSAWEGAPFRLIELMLKKRFDDIANSLRFTNIPPPHYRDKFHQVCQMIAMWNQHMMDMFVAAWVSCLDESMPV
jgi:Transposase IS4